VAGVPVETHGPAIEVRGEQWITLIPKDIDDERLWEFSLTTGRLVSTRGR
jgi:hypothetical protein